MGLVDGADTALSSLAIRHEGLPLHGHINVDTVLATTKLGPPARPAFPSGLAADDSRALRPLKPIASSFVVAGQRGMTGRRRGRRRSPRLSPRVSGGPGFTMQKFSTNTRADAGSNMSRVSAAAVWSRAE
jgi:hypothetical protein